MAVFEYIAKDSAGSEFSGVYTDVENARDLRQELSKMGYSLVKAQCHKTRGPRSSGRIKRADVVAFAFEFAGMYGAGLSIIRCPKHSNSSVKKRDEKRHPRHPRTRRDRLACK